MSDFFFAAGEIGNRGAFFDRAFFRDLAPCMEQGFGEQGLPGVAAWLGPTRQTLRMSAVE
jgi:hypothetical protein